jgi:hypothetical protein
MSQYPPNYPSQTVIINSPPSNGLGVAGFIISLIGLLVTGGILCPVGLLLSFIALFKRPRGFAIAGTVIGAIGTLIPLAIFLIFGATVLTCLGAAGAVAAADASTTTALSQADTTIQNHYRSNGVLPGDFEGNNLIDSIRDGRSKRLRYYQLGATTYEIRSSGMDGSFNTSDDRVRSNVVTPRTTTTLPARQRRTTTPVEPH